ncbi:DUF3313 domain-containing protein [Sandaracinobacter neustonicus]|uniref:DUF3313 domain-containing protein n=1 Tax=Sandaracinobacter neustonicus TaxID=1715348 RepID=A0A501XTD9_9SPHN|nr:DUF3313 family protein [Sandaracinobacter neustonicus]TPE63715.1 DUF3313 domain-containing protein [Sandaracinobacter neustonicus]
MNRTAFSRHTLAAVAAITLFANPLWAEPAPDADGLAAVKAKRVDQAYVLPGADFRPYTAILLEPVDASFAKNWQRDYNSNSPGLGTDITNEEAAKILDQVRTGAAGVFTKSFTKGGYRIVQQPGPDVLRVKVSLSDIRVTAPDINSAGRGRTYARDAGSAVMTLEAADSVSGKLLGRAVDKRDIGDSGTMMWARNSVTNQSDFERAFTIWANDGVKALTNLKAGGNVFVN